MNIPAAAVPRFSIVMPAYNAADTIGETLESVIAQTLEDWELVVVDDGSADGTSDVALKYAAGDHRISVLRQANAGAGPARQAAVMHSHAPLIARLDADDLYMPTYLEELSAFIDEHPDFEIYACNAEVFYPDGHTETYHRKARYDEVMSLSLPDMMEENRIFATAVFRRDIFERAGGFRQGPVEDYDFWLRAMARGARHIFLPRILVRYRIREGQQTGDSLSIWSGSVDALGDLLASGVLDRRLAAKARKEIRRHWRWRVLMASYSWWIVVPGESRDKWFLEPGRYSRRLQRLFKAATLVMVAPKLVELAARGLLERAIALLRDVFPSLRDVRLRRDGGPS